MPLSTLALEARPRYVGSMSEYQYYEFVAIDHPLGAKEQQELRAISTRADISATRFRNEYHWGDLKADPLQLLKRYFDAHLYVTNWGVHRFALRFPRDLVEVKSWKRFCASPCLSLHEEGAFVVLDFLTQDEEPEFVEDADSHLPTLASIRQMLLCGDLRALYLGWLASAQSEQMRTTKREPPVPPGLKNLSGPLAELCTFLFLDSDLLAVAIEESPAASFEKLPEGFTDFIATLPDSEKDRILIGLVCGEESNLAGQLFNLFRKTQTKRQPFVAEGRRTVDELLARAGVVRSARQQAEEEACRKAAERAERQRAEARIRYLDSLVDKQEALWVQVGQLIERKQPRAYSEAVILLRDLNELAERQGTKAAFQARLGELTSIHQKKPAFLSRLRDESLMPE